MDATGAALPAWLEPWGHDLVETKITLGQPADVLAGRVADNVRRATAAHGCEVGLALSAARVPHASSQRHGAGAGAPNSLRTALALSFACGVDALELFEVPYRTRELRGPDWARIALLPPTGEAARRALAEGLRAMAAARGTTGAELARECGLAHAAVSKALNGRGASARTALLLAAALGASPACLCGCAAPARDGEGRA